MKLDETMRVNGKRSVKVRSCSWVKKQNKTVSTIP